MNWQLYVPHRSPDEPLADVALNAHRVLRGDDAVVARELATDAMFEYGEKTAGDLINRIKRASPGQRRTLLDRIRSRVGLPSTGDVEAHRRFEAANRPAQLHSRQRRKATLVPMPGGGFMEIDETEIERERQRDEWRTRQLRERQEERERERRERVAAQQARQDRLARELFGGGP